MEKQESHITDLLASRNDKSIASVISYKKVTFWDTTTYQESAFPIQQSEILAVAFSPDGQFLTAAGRGEVILWDTTTGQKRGTLPSRGILALAFSPDGEILATADGEGRVRLQDMADFDSNW